jgi:hypothetical protein
MTDDHLLFTRALFVDAIVGVGFPHDQVGADAERGGLAWHYTPHGEPPTYLWNRRILETLTTETLQEMYIGLKTYGVSHAN